MHIDSNTVSMILTGIVTILGLWIRHAVVTPSDHERATLLATLANDAAAVVVNLNPGAPWATMLSDVVRKLASNAATPTSNASTLNAAASGALARLGKTNDEGKP